MITTIESSRSSAAPRTAAKFFILVGQALADRLEEALDLEKGIRVINPAHYSDSSSTTSAVGVSFRGTGEELEDRVHALEGFRTAWVYVKDGAQYKEDYKYEFG